MQDSLPRSLTTSHAGHTRRPVWPGRERAWMLAFLAAVAWALVEAGVLRGEEIFNPGGLPVVMRFVRGALAPDLSADMLAVTLDATLVTLAYAVLGACFSLLLGFIGGVLTSEVWWQAVAPERGQRGRPRYRLVWRLARVPIAFLRAIHEIVWGLFFINIIGLDPLSAILAITIPFAAIVAKVFSEILDETPREALQALLNSGVSPVKAFAYGLLPAALPDLISYSFYRFECAIRASAVLGIIGAGGLGYQIFLSLQTLKYEQIWTLLYALFALNGVADVWSAATRRRIGRPSVLAWGTVKGEPQKRVGAPSGSGFLRASLLAGIALAPLSWLYVRPDLGKLSSARALSNLAQITTQAFPANFAYYSSAEWLKLTGVTLSMSLLAVAGAAILSVFLAFPAANNFLLPGGIFGPGKWGERGSLRGLLVWMGARASLLVARSIPAPIWALALLFVIFPGVLPGAAALGLYTLGVLARLVAEVVENMDRRPLVALKAQGGGSAGVFAYGVLPLTTTRFLGYIFYRWEEAIRATAVVGLVGAGGLGLALIQQLRSFNWPAVSAILSVFVGITLLVDWISGAARRAFREG